MFKVKINPIALQVFLSACLLVACGPSQEELDATSTKVAADIFATQTAQAPTATSTPTATLTPTVTPTATITPIPLSDAVLTIKDLPSGFRVQSLADFNVGPEIGVALFGEEVLSGFAFMIETDDFEVIVGQTEFLASMDQRVLFDEMAPNFPAMLIDVVVQLITGEIAQSKEVIPDLDDIGNVSGGATANIGGEPAMRMDVLFLRRENIGAYIWTLYFDGDVPLISITDAAHILDQRMLEVLNQ